MSLPRFPDPSELQRADDARALVHRARGEARRWMIRSVLLALIAGLSFARRWVFFGVVFLLLTAMSFQLARTTRRRAAELAAKLKLLEAP